MAGLLDLFAIGFESDSLKEFEANLKKNKNELEKYEKETKETEEALKKLKDEGKENSTEFQQLTQKLTKSREKTELLKTSIKNLEQDSRYPLLLLKNNFVKLTKTLAKLTIVATTVKKSLEFYEQGEQLDFLANKAGVAVEKLQMLGNAAKRYGGTTEGIAGTLENLRNQYQSLRMGEGGGGLEQAAFKYGVGISSDPEKMLENVAKRMETMRSDAAKWDLANTLGIDEATTRLLMQGQKAYNEELKKAAKYKLYTKEDIERMREYRQLSLDIRMSLDGIVGAIARMLLPAITAVSKVIKTISEWIAEHEGLIKIIGLVITLSTAFAALYFMPKLILWISKGFSGLLIPALTKTAFSIKFLGKTFSASFGGIIFLLTLLITLIEDFYVFMQGGESLIGEIWKRWGYDLDNIRQGFEIWGERIKRWWHNFLSIFNKNLKWEDAFEDIDIVKKVDLNNLNPEQRARLEEIQRVQANPFDTIKKGKNIINAYNQNPLNAMPQGAQSFYYSTESRNMTSNKNAKSITNSNSRTTNIGQMNVNVQANNPKEFMDKTSQLASMDNGIM